MLVKGIVHPPQKIKFFHYLLTLKLLTFIVWKNSCLDQQMFDYQHSSKYLLLCSTEERNSYRFLTNWGWINGLWSLSCVQEYWATLICWLVFFAHCNSQPFLQIWSYWQWWQTDVVLFYRLKQTCHTMESRKKWQIGLDHCCLVSHSLNCQSFFNWLLQCQCLHRK